MADALDTTKYLEYLDKEMSIMGILSAVSVIAPGGILSAVLASGKGPANALWNASSFFIVTGAVMCIVGALYIYLQRSKLAWFYGQICLTEALDNDVAKTRGLLCDADSWASWWPYSCGFTFLFTGFFEFMLAAFLYITPPHWAWFKSHLHLLKITAFVLCPLIATATAFLQWYVLNRYKFSDNYWKDFWLNLSRGSTAVLPPHRLVYTRLGSSPIHGVGVFAIVDIPKGTYVFEPDANPTVKIKANEIEALPPSVRRLYEDFCVLKDREYECPTTFNQLTPSWYLNDSRTPNVAADSDLKFYATRDITAGEELTADYGSYCENASELEIS